MAKKKIDYKEDVEMNFNASSATDCTGLIPALPQNRAEREAYADIYRFSPSMIDEEHEEEEDKK